MARRILQPTHPTAIAVPADVTDPLPVRRPGPDTPPNTIEPSCTMRHRALIQIDALKPLTENIFARHSARGTAKNALTVIGQFATPPKSPLRPYAITEPTRQWLRGRHSGTIVARRGRVVSARRSLLDPLLNYPALPCRPTPPEPVHRTHAGVGKPNPARLRRCSLPSPTGGSVAFHRSHPRTLSDPCASSPCIGSARLGH